MAGKANYLSKTDCLGYFFLNHCFISTSLSVSLILYFSFWQVNQEAVAKSSIVHGTRATLRCTAVRRTPWQHWLVSTQVSIPQRFAATGYRECLLGFCSQNVTVTSLQVACCYRCRPGFQPSRCLYWCFSLFVANDSCFDLLPPPPSFLHALA